MVVVSTESSLVIRFQTRLEQIIVEAKYNTKYGTGIVAFLDFWDTTLTLIIVNPYSINTATLSPLPDSISTI